MAETPHPFDTFYAAFGLDRRETPEIRLKSRSEPELATIKIKVSQIGSLPAMLAVDCWYNAAKGLPGDGGPPFDMYGVTATPQPNGTYWLEHADLPMPPVDTWLSLALQLPILAGWFKNLLLQVGGDERCAGWFVVVSEPEQLAA